MKKKAKDAGLISWCHLNNIMPDSIFHEAGDNMFCFVLFFVLLLLFFFFFLFRLFKVSFFYGVILLLGWKTCNQFYHYNISGLGKILNYKRLRQMELISLQWDLKSETYWDFRLGIWLWGSFVFVCCVSFDQGYCVFIQYDLLEGWCKWILIKHWT